MKTCGTESKSSTFLSSRRRKSNSLSVFLQPILFVNLAFLLIGISLSFWSQADSRPCVRIYFDRVPNEGHWMGKTYAGMLQNLLGHFPEFQQIISPIESYRSGDIETCEASFYIGSYFENAIPQAFYDDFKTTQKQVAWIGYNLWKFSSEDLDTMFGYTYDGLSTLDNKRLNARGEPTFFKDILYKGEVFSKYGRFSSDGKRRFIAPFEMTLLRASQSGASAQTEIIASAKHNGSGEERPYILRNKNRFFVADAPFSYIHEADRYLVFADLLFDILEREPRHREHYAFVRIEDVHPLVPISLLYGITDALTEERVPIHISLIPIFYDPFKEYNREAWQEFVSLNDVPEFMKFIDEMRTRNATFIWHGTTHQLGETRNALTGVSGDDFEFWDAKRNGALAQDSVDFILNRLETGYHQLRRAGLEPIFWLTPHYQASPLSYKIFARVMPWNIGRMIYFNHQAALPNTRLNEEELYFRGTGDGTASRATRLAFFRGLQVAIENPNWSGQFFPYEIYGDIFGQRIIPENLGNSQPVANEFVVQPRSIATILADAKRNLVLRDAWGSAFYHPQLLNMNKTGALARFPGDTGDLRKLVRGLKDLGYRFIRIEDFVKDNPSGRRPEPIYIE